MNMFLTEKARCLRLNAALPKSFWAEVVSTACYLINRSPQTLLGEEVAKEMELELHPVATKNRGSSHPTLGSTCIRASWDLHLEQMDVKLTFLHGDLEEQTYMEQPNGFTQPGHEHLVCKLKKSLYGLKQSPRQWYKRFDSYMLQIDYKQCEHDSCVYIKSFDDGSSIFLLLYVDDMLVAAKNMHDVLALKALLSHEFDMKDLGAATKILGMEIHKDRFEMRKAKSVSIPLANHFKLFLEQCLETNREIEGGGPMCWKSTVQSIVALSTTETEYMAVAEDAKEALWLNRLANELGVEQGGVQLHCDSQSAIYLAKNHVYHARTKHIDVRYYKIRELIASGEIIL
ncbi:UNVERIFIED_CONTAM: Retrovirus-related Pol polyprotein from transposon TNT 1-94 [Sesamum radiatum]|uniref:Retrovirus-related Pol polyprotein from transposon TNT 1-94 n=1 Tax=Sesamum radiatum TaxID=300843 RepID=A0AAW2N096_SESRA